jgi:hypothetical protein
MGVPHASLLIEDPETGAYFVGDMPPYMGTIGGYLIAGTHELQGVPVPPGLKEGRLLEANNLVTPAPLKFRRPTELVGCSLLGNDAGRYQGWLKKVPDEFRDMERKLKS